MMPCGRRGASSAALNNRSHYPMQPGADWSQPPPGLLIRPARRRLLRSALILGLVGVAATALLAMQAAGRGSPLAFILPAMVGAGTLLIVIAGVAVALRRRGWLCLTPAGIEVFGDYGRFTVEWDNLVEAGVHLRDLAGLRLRSRAELLATHRGTSRQRELLETAPRYGVWDVAFSADDLDGGVNRFIDLVTACHQAPERRADLLRIETPGRTGPDC